MKNRRYISLLLGCCLSAGMLVAQSNDPCDAPILDLSPGANCIPQTGSLSGAADLPAAGPNIPYPWCANYVNGKWYKVVIPESEELVVTMFKTSDSFLNGAMAFYKAPSCNGPFSTIACDDDGNPSSSSGLMPKIKYSITLGNPLTPGDTIYIRVWRNGGGVGEFAICAQAQKCLKQNANGTPNACSDSTTAQFCFSHDSLMEPSSMTEYCSPSGTGVSLGMYNCLVTTPNPTWFHLEVQESGYLHVELKQTTNTGGTADVDFAIYGPFGDIATGCNSLSVPGHHSSVQSCSYSGSHTEQVIIQNAIAGQIYILLVTNYSGAAGTFTFTQKPDNVAIPDCSFLCEVEVEVTPDTCSQGLGTVKVISIQGDLVEDLSNDPKLDIVWDTPNADTSATVSGLSPGTYSVTASSSVCKNGTASAIVKNVVPTYSTTYTKVSCPNGADGTATAHFEFPASVNATGFTATYLWDDPLAQTTQTATGLSAGTYSCKVSISNGCEDTISVVIDEIPPMIATIVDSSNVKCYTKHDGMLTVKVTQGTPPYSFSWSKSAITDSIATDLPVGENIVTIIDMNGCTTTASEVLSEPDSLQLVFISPDTLVCIDDPTFLTAQGIGGSSPYTYTWSTATQGVVDMGQSVTVYPPTDKTLYCVTLSEACGSPTVDTCMTVHVPTPIPPSLIANQYESCKPGIFHIENVSSNIAELYSTHIDFGNHAEGTVLYGGDTTVIYNSVGFFDLTVTNTSIYGCKYTTVLKDFFKVNANPIAHFYVAGNPTTIFETTLQAHQLASSDVVKWEWLSPYSDPDHSHSENPVFAFPEGVIAQYPVTLVVTSYYGCTDTITLDVIVEDAILFYVPNTFTPDNDPYNQTWRFVMQGGDIHDFELQIIDRWGKQIWKTNDPNIGWDGKLPDGQEAKTGIYIWKAHVKQKHNDGRNQYNGIVNLIR